MRLSKVPVMVYSDAMTAFIIIAYLVSAYKLVLDQLLLHHGHTDIGTC